MLGNSKYETLTFFHGKTDKGTRHNTSVDHNRCYIDVSGAFIAAWWLRMLMTLKAFNSPTNIYKLTKFTPVKVLQ